MLCIEILANAACASWLLPSWIASAFNRYSLRKFWSSHHSSNLGRQNSTRSRPPRAKVTRMKLWGWTYHLYLPVSRLANFDVISRKLQEAANLTHRVRTNSKTSRSSSDRGCRAPFTIPLFDYYWHITAAVLSDNNMYPTQTQTTGGTTRINTVNFKERTSTWIPELVTELPLQVLKQALFITRPPRSILFNFFQPERVSLPALIATSHEARDAVLEHLKLYNMDAGFDDN